MIKLPKFEPNSTQQNWVKSERETARLVQLLWRHSKKSDQSNPEFFKILIRCSWVNGGDKEPRRRLRNREIANWLGLNKSASDDQLSHALQSQWGFGEKDANWLVTTPSGITNFYSAHRTEFFRQVELQSKPIGRIFRLAAQFDTDVDKKIERIAKMTFGLASFKVPNGGESSMFNGLTPVLACLDPHGRFPIVNAQTADLLKLIRHNTDITGVLALRRLIGKFGISDSFDLDVYSSNLDKPSLQSKRGVTVGPPQSRSVGLKSEEQSIAEYAKRKVVIRKKHNELTNKFKLAVEWKHELLERDYDILIENWRRGRLLLIEAKSETVGLLGRTQLRQAIGQLFDYRWQSFRQQIDNVDLALLTPTKPEKEILDLLKILKIEALWFEGKTLSGTISLIGD